MLNYKILPYGHSKILRTNRRANFMGSSTTLQEAAILQHQRAIHHGTVILAALDSIHCLIHYLVLGLFRQYYSSG